MELLARSGVRLAGRHVVVLGRSLLVGKPIALLAVQKKAWANATVTLCHSQTTGLPAIARQADILIRRHRTRGIRHGGDGEARSGGDRCGHQRRARSGQEIGLPASSAMFIFRRWPDRQPITPVPGGVGPMTVAMLMKNTSAPTDFRRAE